MALKKPLRNTANGWTPHWSGRGTATMDFMEKFGASKREKPRITRMGSIDKLKLLIDKFPKNGFYRSLYRQRARLSPKQDQMIKEDYNLKIEQATA